MSDPTPHTTDATSGNAAPGGPAPSGDGHAPRRASSWRRRVAWGVGGLVTLVGGLLLAFLLVLQSETGATLVARTLAAQVNPLTGTELTVGRAGGSWVGSLRLYDVSLTRVDSASGDRRAMAHLDTLQAQYDLLALLQRRVHVRAVAVAGLSVSMRQDADSSWDWARVLPPSEPDADTTSGFAVQVDRFSVRRSEFDAAFYAGGRDSTAQARGIRLLGSQLRIDDAFSVRLDTLGLRARLPGDATDLTLAVRGVLTPERVRLDTLRLDSPRSHVRGHGLARLPRGPDDTLDDVDLALTADPLAFRDVDALLPLLGLDSDETVALSLRTSGSGRRLSASLDARFSDGGTVTAEAEATPSVHAASDTSTLQYRLDARIRDLTTSLIAARDPETNRINADASFDLQGPTLDRLSGPLQVRVSEARLFGLRTDTTRLAASFRDGVAEVDLDGRLNGTGLRVTGRTRPLDEIPTYNLTAEIRDLDVASFAPESAVDTQIRATLRTSGRVGGDEGLNVSVDADLAPSTVGTHPIDGGTASARVTPDSVRFDVALRLPAGSVEAAGRAALDDSEQFVLDRGRIRNLNVAALTGDTTASALNATLSARGRGFDPQTLRLDATVGLGASFYDTVRLDTLASRIALRNGTLDATADASVNDGTWSLAASGRPFDAVPTVTLSDGRFRNVDVGAFATASGPETPPDSLRASRLDGTFSASLRGADPQSMTLDARVDLDSSRVYRQRLDRGALTARLADGDLTASVEIDVPDGRIALDARARPFDDVPTYRLTQGTVDGVNVGAFAGLDGADTDLNGTLTLDGRGASMGALTLDAGLTLTASRINRASIRDGAWRLRVEDGRATTDASLAVDDDPQGRLRVDGRVDSLTATPRYAVRASAAALDVSALAGLDTTLTARADTVAWSLDGRGSTLDDLSGTTQLRSGAIQIDRFRIDAIDLGGRLRDGLLAVDTVAVQSNAFVARGGGDVALAGDASSDFDLVVNVADLEPLRRFAGAQKLSLARGRAEVNLYGTANALRFDGRTELRSLVYDDARLANAALSFSGSTRDQRLDRVEIEGNAGFLSLSTLSIERTELDATYDSSMVNVRASTQIDADHRAVVGASLDTRTDQQRLTLHTLDLRLGPDTWELLQDASLTYGDAYRVSSLLLYSGDQQIAADGLIDFDGQQSFILTLESFRMGSVADLFGLSGLDGRVTGTVDLSGPAAAPRIHSSLNMDVESEGQPVGTLRLTAGYDSLTATVDATLTHHEGGTLTAEGSLPADLRLDAATPVDVDARPVRLTAVADGFSVGWIDPFLDPTTVRDVRGRLAARLDVRGTLDRPEFSGTATLRDGSAYLPVLELAYTRAEADVTFSGSEARVDRAVVRSGNGRLQASGSVNFSDLTLGQFDLALTARDFVAIDSRAYRRAVVNGDMTLRGSTQRPVLTGSVQVQRADVYFAEATEQTADSELATVQLSEDDQLRLEERFGIRVTAADTTTFDVYEAMRMDLTVEIERDTWLRYQGTPEMNVQFTGDLDVSKESNQDAQVFGTIDVVAARSTIRYVGQQFQIERGTLTFNGDPTLPYLSIEAVYEKRAAEANQAEVTIRLTLDGRPDELSPRLSSEPPMGTRDILSYLATGQPAGDVLSSGGSIATEVSLGLASSIVENLAASQLGLDVVRIQARPSGTSYLTLGRYLTPRLFVAAESPLNIEEADSGLDLTVEYSITNALLVRALRRQQSLQLNLLLEYSY